jgi:succinate dehydrogenase / fumarate reductase iron-sulfur subunit
MRINGVNKLACKVLVKDYSKDDSIRIQVEPLLGLPVLKDLVVDMEPFFAHYRQVMPYFVNDTPLPANGRERLQSIEDRETFDDTTKCILCAACTTACPSFWANGEYVGPAAIVQAHRFIFDSRDQALDQRLDLLAEPNGVWRCRTIYNCTPACPRGIQVTRAIGEVKVAIQRGTREGVVVDPPKSGNEGSG